MFGGSKPTFGQPASTGFGFGATSNTSTPFGGQSTGFGQTSAFGQPANTGLFGNTTQNQGTGLFGASTSTAFGQPQQQQPAQQTGFGGFGTQQPQQQTSLFGSTAAQPANTSLFGASNTTFGAAKPTGFGFAQPAQATTSLFGQASTSTAPTTGFFGQQAQNTAGGMFGSTTTAATPAFGMTQENQGTSIAKYQMTLDTDTIVVKGNQSNVSTKQHCITFMKEYANKSLEELRLEDYMANRKGPQSGGGGLFGSTQQNTGGMFGSTQPSTGLFGQTSAAPATGGLFGNTTNTLGGFGQTNNAFGATTSQQNNSLFNKPFGQATTTQTGFGGFGTSTAAATPFGQTKPLFGATGGTSGGMFGSNTSTFGQPTQQTTGFGATPFGQTQPQQQQTTPSLFGGAQPQTSAFGNTSTTGFGGFGTNTSQPSTGLFGKPAATGFGAQPTTGFGAPANTTPTLGGFGQPQQGGLFGNTLNKPATGFTGFGQPQTSVAPLGTSAFGTGTSLFGQNQQQKPGGFFSNTSPNQSTGLFGNTTNTFGQTNTLGGGIGGFGTTSTLGGLGQAQNTFGQPQQQSQAPPIHQQILQMTTSPYGDNPIYKDLKPSTGASDEALKVTNPAAQKAMLESISNKFKVSPAIGNAVRVKPVGQLSKKSLFDGLEEYDASLAESFTLKPNAKRLILKPKGSPAAKPLQESNVTVDDSLRFKGAPANVGSAEKPVQFQPKKSLETSERFDNVIPTTQPQAQTDNGRRVSWLQTVQFDKQKEQLSDTLMETTLRELVTSNPDKQPVNRVPATFSPTQTQMQSIQQQKTIESDSSVDLSLGLQTPNQSLLESSRSPPQQDSPPHPTGIVLTRQGYYTIPSLDELMGIMDEQGRCIVNNFTIGRRGYGNVYFNDTFDVSGLNLDEIVHFRHKEIIVYPDDENKPPVGQGLNRKAQVTLDQVWPQDKTLHEPIKDPERLQAMNFEGKLRRVCDKADTRFLEYRPDTGSWVFKVDHFSKYGLTDSDEEDSAPTDPKLLKLGPDGVAKKPENGDKNGNLPLQGKDQSQEPLKLGGVQQKELLSSIYQIDQRKLGGFLNDQDFTLDYMDTSNQNKSDYFSKTTSIAMEMDVNPHKLQLMKASFFGDDDYDGRSVVSDTSESCGSADQIVPNRGFGRGRGNYLSSGALSSISEDQQMDDDILTSVGSVKSSATSGAKQQQPILNQSISKMKELEGPKSAPLIIKPQIFYETGIEIGIPLQKSFISSLKNIKIDPIFFNGRRFKPGWGPYSTLQMPKATNIESESNSKSLLHISKHCNGRLDTDYSQSLINRLQFPSNDRIKHFHESIVPHLEIELSHDLIRRDTDMECPYFTSNGGLKALEEHVEMAKKLAHLTSLDSYAASVWSLCSALWGEREELEGLDELSHNVVMFRRDMFSEWLEDVITDSDLLEIRSRRDESYLDQLLDLLFSHKVADACEIAISNDDYNLSMLLAQLSGGSAVKQLMNHQLALWQDVEADKYVEEKRLRAFMTVAGLPIFESNQGVINIYDDMDWIKALAYHLWYLVSPTSSITDALYAYEDTLESTKIPHIAPKPVYSEKYQTISDKPLKDLRYHILHLYSRKSHPMDSLLNPATHTFDPMDFRLSWLLLQTFESIGYTHTSETVRSQIHMSFANQLENYGLWQWAIYVLLHINERNRREAAIKSILVRHIQFEFEPDYIKLENFIVDKLGIPETWIYFAKAVRAGSYGRRDDQAKFLLHAKEWSMAHEIIMSHIAPNAILNDKVPYLKMLLKEFKDQTKVSNWTTQGKVLLDFIEINETVEKLNTIPEDQFESALDDLKLKFNDICSVIKLFPCPTAKHRLCQSEIAQRLAQLIRTFYASDNSVGERCHLLKLALDKLPLSPEYAKTELKHLLSAFLDEQLRIE
uniref:Nuclear pore complex protein Nup98-Nup96 n=1 Tax=Culicoides sonorensis TaxID=179676 RepID=A0A336KXZ5_CULSO